MSQEYFKQLKDALIEGDPDLVVELTHQALQAGLEPLAIIDEGLVPGMQVVGEKFESGEFYLPNLIIAAEGMKQAMVILEPELQTRQQVLKTAGKVVIGTVQGDIHEIGKSLVGTILAANGFQVYDLGVDVSADKFIAKIQETGANLVGLSALLTTTMVVQRDIIASIQKAGLREKVKVMVGGAPVTHSWAAEIGADGYAEDAIGAVALAKRLVSN